MGWIKQQPEQHKCDLPVWKRPPDSRKQADGQVGDIWQCDDCSRLWVVKLAGWPGPQWRLAGWWTRRKLRKERLQ